MRISILSLLVISQVVISCGKKKEKDPSAEEQRANALAVAVEPADALKGVSTAMSSVGEIKSEKGTTMNPAALALPLAEASTYCENSGNPKSGQIDGGNGKYAGLVAYCNFSMHPDGPDTVLGAIDRVQGILCALGKLTYDGTERTIKMKFTTDCFSETFVDMAVKELGTNEVDAIVTAKEPVTADLGSTEYAKYITFNIPTVGFAYDIIYKQDGAVLSAAIREPKDDDGNATDHGTYFAIKLDRGATTDAEGSVTVDGRFTQTTEQNGGSPSVRHVRAYSKGKYDLTTNTLTTASTIEFITADYSKNTGSGYFRSVKGNPTDGFSGIVSSASGSTTLSDHSIWTITGDQRACYGDGACTGNDGIYVKSADDLKFMSSVFHESSASVYVNAKTMFLNAGILDFTSVVLSE